MMLQERVLPEQRASRAWPIARAVLILAAALVAARALIAFARRVPSDEALAPYLSPTYWLTYEHGFVRRGLVGEVLRWLAGGEPPSYAMAVAAAAVLTVSSVAALLILGVLLARRVAGSPTDRLAVVALIVATPLAVSLQVRDFGRPDAIGLVALVALAGVPWRRAPWPAAVATVAALTTVAVAAEEFLLLVVGPVALLVLWKHVVEDGRRRAWMVAALLPATMVAVASAVTTAPQAAITAAIGDAARAGAPAPRPLMVNGEVRVVEHSSVGRLATGWLENAGDYYNALSVPAIIVMSIVWCIVFLATVGGVWMLLGRSLRGPWFVVLVVAGSLSALALSVAGIDYRRWWMLAAVAALSAVLVVGPRSRAAPSRLLAAAAVIVGVAGVVLQPAEVFTADLSWGLLNFL